ncbi:hypothetical protein [Sellimonas intestinalis]|uniref:hypothetical protein n=1 Tax=Sellimonas intestinalis TaxID=1653434 RepID=UPI00399A3E9F
MQTWVSGGYRVHLCHVRIFAASCSVTVLTSRYSEAQWRNPEGEEKRRSPV